ncbi:MAG: hypothetical protein K2X86_00910, partial [Cytophagaceae bacterium]|nr:hypothetical protein [Cytophagaceae bacterium]
MNKQTFLQLLKNPAELSKNDLEGLEEVLANFPYCQAAHILNAKGTSDQGKMLAEQKVRKAAVYSSERKNLKHLLEKKEEKAKASEIIFSAIQADIIPEKKPTEPKQEPFQAEKINYEKTKEIKPVLIQGDLKKEQVKADESRLKKDQFFQELEENLRNLHNLKIKAALTGENNAVKKSAKAQTTAKSDEVQKAKELIPEKIKEHIPGDILFSSRLDEVLNKEEEKNNANTTNEAELLLNYLSFLETNKKSAVKDKKKTEEIIDKFINEEPSIPPLNTRNVPEEAEDKAAESY